MTNLSEWVVAQGQVAKAARPNPRDLAYLYDIADRFEPAVRRAFLEAVQRVKTDVEFRRLQRAIETGRVSEVLAVLNLSQTVAAALQAGAFTSALRDTYEQSGVASIARLHDLRGVSELRTSLRFDRVNPRAVEFLRAYDFGLIREVTAETQRAVGNVVLRAFEQGGHPFQQALTIVGRVNPKTGKREGGIVGLTQRQAQAVMNYRAALIEDGASPEKVARLAQQYENRMLRYRGRNIARTETMRASNEGTREGWRQAADVGFLEPGDRRRWIVGQDDRLCDLCRAVPGMNPDGVEIGQPFQTPSGPVISPPLHPQCRCVTALIIA